jgi:hypothetical protein
LRAALFFPSKAEDFIVAGTNAVLWSLQGIGPFPASEEVAAVADRFARYNEEELWEPEVRDGRHRY